jgi:small-conductance mechanosensitive channel
MIYWNLIKFIKEIWYVHTTACLSSLLSVLNYLIFYGLIIYLTVQLDGLSTEMSQQKSKLKERLQQMKAKKQQKSTASFAQSKGADGDWEQEEIRVEEEKLQRLETNYNNIVDMLADASSEDLQRIGLTRLKDLLENSEGKAMKLQVK